MAISKPSFNRIRRPFLALGILFALACGPDWFDENEFLSYFLPESSNANPQDRRYFFSPQLYYTYGTDRENAANDSLLINENIRAWAAYAGGDVPLAAVAKSIYKADVNPTNPFVGQLRRTHAPALDYLTLATSAEKASAGGDVWSPVPADTSQLSQLLNVAKARYKTAPDAFLKERYAFQAVKLADQLGKFSQCRLVYAQLVEPLPNKTFISDWALCRQAGATLAEGDTARAIYAFAQVFDRCPTRRQQAEASLRIHGIRFREEALPYAKNDREKAAVYALCALQPLQDALPFLKEIVKLTPQSPLVELIMAREINRNEYYFLTNTSPGYGYDAASRQDSVAFEKRRVLASTYADQLSDFAQESATKLSDAAFWYTAAAYVAYLETHYDTAQTLLDKASQASTTNDTLKKQMTVQRMLLLAAQTKTITPAVESQLIGYLESFSNTTDFRLTNAFVKVCQQVARTYQQAGNETRAGGWLSGCSRKTALTRTGTTAKAFLLTMLTTSQLNKSGDYVQVNTDQLFIEDTSSAATVQQVVAFAEQPNLTDFDRRLLKLTGFNADYLYTLLGRRLMAENRYGEAGAAFARVNPKAWSAEPFLSYFKKNPLDVAPTKQDTTGENSYTPVEFARRMAQLEKDVTTLSGDQAARAYYELGCGAYNLSWYGNAWVLVRRSWSSAEPAYSSGYTINPTVDGAQTDRQLLHNPYYTTASAKAFFKKALMSAKNAELAAKACFMAARCEQNELANRLAVEERKRGYSGLDKQAEKALIRKFRQEQYGHFFTKLSTDFKQTQFQADLVRECATYADFIAHR